MSSPALAPPFGLHDTRPNALPPCPARKYATLTFTRGAVVALGIGLFGGLLSVAYTVPAIAALLEPLGIDLRWTRPLHTIFGVAFVFLGGQALVHRYLQDVAGPITEPERWRLRIQVICWAVAGSGIALTLPLGITTGREYMSFHPIWSIPILVGWLCFVWNFFGVVGRDFWRSPVFVTMWGVGALFFLYTFVEQHLWLIPEVFQDPIVDRRIQWKATGTLVGSFNLFVYGALVYVGERLSGDNSYSRSRVAYALLGVGLLNSFTNYAHHTYHLPQSHLVKWVAFTVSMLEIIILFRAITDVWKLALDTTDRPFCQVRAFFGAAKWWSMAMLFTSLLISIPPLNTIVHGTYAIAGHAMGTMIGIDTMVLMGALTTIIAENIRSTGDRPTPLHTGGVRRTVFALNIAAFGMVAWLHVVGVVDGVSRYLTPQGAIYVRPEWLSASSGPIFAVTGTVTFVCFALLVGRWLPMLFARHPRRAQVGGP